MKNKKATGTFFHYLAKNSLANFRVANSQKPGRKSLKVECWFSFWNQLDVFVYTCNVILLLFAAAVGHRVPDGKICCCGSLHLIPVFSFSSLKHDLFTMHPLAVLSHLQRRFFTYNTYHTSSVITDMRGAKAAVSPPRRSPSCIYTSIIV